METGKNTADINNKISFFDSVIPIFFLIILLFLNVYVFYGDLALEGSNQFILLTGAFIAILVGIKNKVNIDSIFDAISKNIKSITTPILILLLVGSLAGSWLLSGIIPSMIYYGFKIINASFFLPSCIIICALTSFATGSSWSTSATVGIALIGIGKVLGFETGMVAGAVVSGAYFGDKMSPLSDTTNLAAAVTESNLFEHIKYMMTTTFPTILITFIFFLFFNLFNLPGVEITNQSYVELIPNFFNTSPVLFLVPLFVIILIIKKINPVIALFLGTLSASFFALIFQGDIIDSIIKTNPEQKLNEYMVIMNSIVGETNIETNVNFLNELLYSSGMAGMLDTIWLVICAMVFGGTMDGIGALKKISTTLLNFAKSTFSLFANTVLSCLTVNLTASDQYLSIVIPGKMYSESYKQRGLSSVNLSRTIEDSGTVTSVLIPWNTCGAYQSGVLNVSVFDYFIYAIFNWLSPITTLTVAYLKFKIKKV
tara:strand:- start:10601 stop:12052 length:1452 start_codon:yes stop_codon:yes gene_type:complete